MVKVNWIIIDDFSNISLEEFDNEWCAIIGGDFELVVNQNSIGYCSYKKKQEDEAGLEDVLYWLRGLLMGVKCIGEGNDYELQLMTRNRCALKINVVDSQRIKIYLIDIFESKIIWEEEVYTQEFESEVYKNVTYFLKIVEEKNPKLLKSEWIKELYINNR